MPLATIGTIASIGSSLMGAFGKGKGKPATQITGFDSLNKEDKDFVLKVLAPKMRDYALSEYQGVPMRRLTEADLDPIHGNPALQGMQDYRDQMKRLKAIASYGAPSGVAETVKSLDPSTNPRQQGGGWGQTGGVRSVMNSLMYGGA